MRMIGTALAAAVLAAGPGLWQAAAAQAKWDMPTGYPATNFHTETIQKFADKVKADSGGKLTITVHANASLFKVPEIKRAVQTGQAQIGELLMSNLANENPLFEADNVPFLASSYAEAKKLWVAQRPAIEKALDAQGMKLLYAVPWPPQGIYAKKDLNTIDDMKGVKFRAYNPATSRLAALTGAVPVTIQAAELSQALATGVVQSFISSGSTGYDSKVWEQLTHFYDVQAWLPKNMIFVNKAAFAALDAATQKAVVDAAAWAEGIGWQVSEEKTNWYLEQLAAKGMKVQKPSQALKDGWLKLGETLTAEWLQKAGAEGKAIVDAYRR